MPKDLQHSPTSLLPMPRSLHFDIITTRLSCSIFKMRTLRPLLHFAPSHPIHPSLRSRALLLRRHASTHPSPPPPPPPDSSPSPPPPPRQPPSFLRHNRLPLLLTTLSLLLGLGAGSAVTHMLAPPPMPAPDTHEDGVLIADLNTRIDDAFIVKVLRGKCLGVARQLKGGDGEAGWVELEPRQVRGEEGGKEKGKVEGERMVEHLRGARGTGVERIFWERESGKIVAVVWFGGGVAGWPGVTHGGMLATALVEKLALADHLAVHGAAGAAGEEVAGLQRGLGRHVRVKVPRGVVEAPRQPEELSLTYKKPTFANDFYVIRVTPAWRTGMGEEEEAEGRVGMALPVGERADWEAAIETMDRKACVLAQAKFAPAGSLAERAERQMVETTKRSYAEFKDWLWPSRQKNSQID